MAVTIQQIAERAGVSRGTVDRALNHRGRIKAEVAERIFRIADEMGYVQKERKKRDVRQVKIGIVTQLAGSSFMLEINRGIAQAKAELQDRGVEVFVEEGVSVDEDEQLKAIDALVQKGIRGLAIMPVDSEKIREKLNRLADESGILIVTFNSDIVGTRRCCFVGMDNQKSGRTAAGLMAMLTGGVGKILVITGFFTNNVDNRRVDGFLDEIKKSYPGLEPVGVQGSYDDADEVEKAIVNTMQSVPDLSGILVVSAGQAGIARAFGKLQIQKRPYVIIYDLTPRNKAALETDIADFLIDQDGYVQGYEPPCILADMLVKKQPAGKEYRYTDINIKTKYNI